MLSQLCVVGVWVCNVICGLLFRILLCPNYGDLLRQRSGDVCDASLMHGDSDDSFGRIYATSMPIELQNVQEEFNEAQ